MMLCDFSYHGEKLQRHISKKPKRLAGGAIISSIFDDPLETDPMEPLLRRADPHHIKYRHDYKFVKAKSSDEKLPQTMT